MTYQGLSITDDENSGKKVNKSRFSTVGHGIKMYLCKKIINSHHGKIYIRKFGKDTNNIVFSIPAVRKKQSANFEIFSKFQPYKL